VSGFPIIYDFASLEYRHNITRSMAWRRIAEIVGVDAE
jgi:hypothetical protein